MVRASYFRAVTVLAAMAAATLTVGLLMLTKAPAVEAQTRAADLRVDMIGLGQLFVGEDDYYRIVVTNSGSEPLVVTSGTVLVRDTLTGATFNSAGYNRPYEASFGTDLKTVDFATTADDTIGPGNP